MLVFLFSLVALAIPRLRCTDIPSLHSSPHPLSRTYSPELFALRQVKWEELQENGVQKSSTLEIGDGWILYSAVEGFELAFFIQERLWPDALVHTQENVLYIEARDGRWTAKKTNGGLLFAKDGQEPEDFPDFWGEMIAGCQLYLESVNLPYMQGTSKEGVMLAFFHDDPKVQIRVPREGDMPKLFRKKALKKWSALKTERKPTMTAAFGEEPLSVLEDPLFVLPESIAQKDIREIDKKLHIGAGVQLAVFEEDAVFSIPLQGWFGCPLPRWQIEWGLRKYEKLAPHRRKIPIQNGEWFVEAERGRIVVASSVALLDDALTDEGVEWFSNTKRETHFLAKLNIPESLLMFIGPLDSVSFILAAQDEFWELDFHATTQSKAKPNQLFLTYFSTLQKWKKANNVAIPYEVDRFLREASLAQHLKKNFEYDEGAEYPYPIEFFSFYRTEGANIIVKDLDGVFWYRNPKAGTQICSNDVTSPCKSVN